MEIAAEVKSVRGKQEDWVDLSPPKDGAGGINLQLKKGKSPVIRIDFRFISAEFKDDQALVVVRALVKVVAQDGGGVVGRMLGKDSAIVAAEAEVDFNVFMTGSRLDIENAELGWESAKRLPDKDSEQVLKAVAATPIPEEMKKGLAPGVVALVGLLGNVSIKIG